MLLGSPSVCSTPPCLDFASSRDSLCEPLVSATAQDYEPAWPMSHPKTPHPLILQLPVLVPGAAPGCAVGAGGHRVLSAPPEDLN